MAHSKRPSLLQRLSRRLLSRPGSNGADVRRIEERRRGLAAATDEWLSLLREMEHAGQTGDARYEAYYQAYLRSKQQQKRADLDLFNLRSGVGD